MASQQLIDYIKQRFAQGATKAEIRESLSNNGWLTPDIDEGFKSLESPAPIIQPTPSDSPVSPDIQSAQPAQPFSTFATQTPKQKSKLPFIIIAAVVGLFLIGGVALGYYYFQMPETVIKRMMDASESVKSVEFQGAVDFEISGNSNNNSAFDLLGDQGKFTMNFNGLSNNKDASNTKGSLYFDINAAGSTLLALEMRQINKILYFNLINAPILEILGLNSSTNQWIKIDTKALESQPGFESLDKNLAMQDLSSEQIEKIDKILQKSKILKIIEKLPSEKIEGIDTYHYKFPFDKDELKNLLMDATVVVNDKPLTEKETKEMEDAFENIKFIEGEIWIGKKDLLLYKIILNLKMEEADPSFGTIGVQMIAKILFKNYNKPVQIEVPSPTKNFEEIFGPLFTNIFTGSTTSTTTPGIFY